MIGDWYKDILEKYGWDSFSYKDSGKFSIISFT